MKEILTKLIQAVQIGHKGKVFDFIEGIIERENDVYLISILEEIKSNFNNNKFDYVYLGIDEVIDYLGLDEELSDIYKNYLNYIWEE